MVRVLLFTFFFFWRFSCSPISFAVVALGLGRYNAFIKWGSYYQPSPVEYLLDEGDYENYFATLQSGGVDGVSLMQVDINIDLSKKVFELFVGCNQNGVCNDWAPCTG